MQLGILLTLLGLFLLLGWFIGGRKKNLWRNLGLITGGIGMLIVVIGLVLYFATQ
jgi:hypothetical protein